MSDIGTEESKNKTPHKMARLAWPKSKYGVILAIIIIITANITPYFALGNATPRILVGLNSSLLFFSDI